MRHLIPISGKDSLATALFMSVHTPREYEYFYNDNGAELPETYAWLDKVAAAKGWVIQRIGSDLHGVIESLGFLPSHQRRYCTSITKIKPMEEWLGKDDCTVYYGLRADEDRPGYRGTRKNIKPAYPLKDNNIDIAGVWIICQAQGLLPPAFEWPALKDAVAAKTDITDLSFLQPWERHILFSGRTRPNCYFCFYQRQYEYMWLLDTHPTLYEKAIITEQQNGADGFTWRDGYALTDLKTRRDEIINRRADEVVKIIEKRRQGELFTDHGTTLIGATSCGLMCGK